ncbi:hypothetical protein LLEC1_02816 [Akanthomyces lecanii]|uniref:Uncharacterized protein n=1 Tax=Cordyceps confragosa TaxID=2714763 RepID=A0A179IGX7_CORDF|nr:hypothetical protein LLEC1_02816 [Akanthomyces lecanii]
MAPVPSTATPSSHIHVARHAPQTQTRTWSTFVAENEQPTAAMCLALSIVTLLVVALLLYTGRRWEACNSSSSFRRRICPQCRDKASTQAARLRTCPAENMELSPTIMTEKDSVTPASWHGSNMLNTSWGWMS